MSAGRRITPASRTSYEEVRMAKVGQGNTKSSIQPVTLFLGRVSELVDSLSEPLPGSRPDVGHPFKKPIPAHRRRLLDCRLLARERFTS